MMNENHKDMYAALATVTDAEVAKVTNVLAKHWNTMESAEDKCRLLVWRLAYTFNTYVGEGLGRALDGLSSVHFECLAAMDLGMLARHTAAVLKFCNESGAEGHLALSNGARECWITLLTDLVNGNE